MSPPAVVYVANALPCKGHVRHCFDMDCRLQQFAVRKPHSERSLNMSVFSKLAFGTMLLTFAYATGAPSAFADTVTFKADLKAASEVPPNDSKGSGSVTATFDTGTKSLAWKGTYSGLTGEATMGHFHGPAEAGKN